ncbi:MAG TPA: DinB family protein [Pyrinomonadaceae bacterium]|nr:DinB family protein [Pyrinomonadaceae bacterium]
MKTEAERIAEQLRRAYEGPAWHGPDLSWLLEGLTAEQAAARPVEGVRSIWELVNHIIAWQDAPRRRLAGDPADLSEEEDFPPVSDTSEEAWGAALAKLRESNEALRAEVLCFGDERLDEPVVEKGSSAYVTLHGSVHHTLYHAGQIAVIKRALGLPPVTKRR